MTRSALDFGIMTATIDEIGYIVHAEGGFGNCCPAPQDAAIVWTAETSEASISRATLVPNEARRGQTRSDELKHEERATP